MEDITYNPQKEYKWEPEQQIVLTGQQFGYINAVLNNLLKSPEAQRAVDLLNAVGLVQQIIKTEVEAGNFKEVQAEEVPAHEMD